MTNPVKIAVDAMGGENSPTKVIKGIHIHSLESKNIFDGTVQIMATIDVYGNLIDSKILISSGNNLIDDMAINILRESAPFAPFNKTMSNEYSVLEIIRDWNFSNK